jgi:hypothetical protein
MAQAGYTPISLYYSTTAAAAPIAGNLVPGELAINITDGKLYYENNAGVVTLLAQSGSAAPVTTFSAGTTGFTPNTATSGAVTLAGTLITSNGGTGLASFTAGDLTYYAAGTALTKLAIGTANQILTSSGTAPQWSSAITVTGVTDSGNLTFTGTSNRITGDFSNATQASRVNFQTSTANSATLVGVIPNGTGNISQFQLFNNSDPANAARMQIGCQPTEVVISSTITGTGTYVPITMATGGSERLRIDTSGNVGIGTNSPSAQLQVAGSSSVSALKIPNIEEVATISATAATGTINYDITTQSVLFYTSNASANWTVNFRGSSGTSLNTLMQTGESMSCTFLATQGATAYYNSVVQVDGTTSGVTTRWQGSAPTSGNASSLDSYTYVIIKTANATFTVLATQTKFV